MKIHLRTELLDGSIGQALALSCNTTLCLLRLFLLVLLGFTSSCATYKDNIRSQSLSRYSVVGVRQPHFYPFGSNPYCIVDEDVSPLPLGQDYLLLVDTYIEGFWRTLGGVERMAATANNTITVKTQGTPAIKITPLGSIYASADRLYQLFIVSVSHARVGENFEAAISINVKQKNSLYTSTVIEQKDFSKKENLRFAIANEDPKLMYGWNKSPILISDISQYRVIKDVGEVEIAPGGIINDIMEPFVSLKKKAMRRGANAITDVRVWFKDEYDVSNCRYGLRAKAVVVDLSQSQ